MVLVRRRSLGHKTPVRFGLSPIATFAEETLFGRESPG